MDAHQHFKKVRPLRDLVRYGRFPIFGTDLSLAREHDAGGLISGEKEQVLQPSLEEVVPSPPRDQDIQMAAVGMALAVRIVGEDHDPGALGQFGVGGLERDPGGAQQGVSHCEVLVRAQDLGKAKLEVIEVNVGTAAVLSEKLPGPVLRIVA